MPETIISILNESLKAADPFVLIPKNISVQKNKLIIANREIDLSTINKIYLLAAGKAAAAMTVAAENELGNLLTEGLCITKYQHGLPLRKCQLLETAHPVPDSNSVNAGAAALHLLQKLKEKDLLIFLLSGGASALMADIPGNSTLEEIQLAVNLLINSGATIQEMNTVRKHLSQLKGGQLMKVAYPAWVYSLIISDVPGDDLSAIGSGPAVADNTSFRQAMDIIEKYRLQHQLPYAVFNHLQKGVAGEIPETPKPGETIFNHSFTEIISGNQYALAAAKKAAETRGYTVILRNETVTGDTNEMAQLFASQLLHYSGETPVCFLWGGETTLAVTGSGKGGRNQHFVLQALKNLKQYWKKEKKFTLLSAGTDGTDGPTDAAGAIITSELLTNDWITAKQIDDHLSNFDSYHFFKKVNSLIITGPTHTNVMDIMIALIE